MLSIDAKELEDIQYPAFESSSLCGYLKNWF
jgi:hypothetical protein